MVILIFGGFRNRGGVHGGRPRLPHDAKEDARKQQRQPSISRRETSQHIDKGDVCDAQPDRIDDKGRFHRCCGLRRKVSGLPTMGDSVATQLGAYAGYISLALAIGGMVVGVVNHKKVVSTCCKKEASFSLDIDATTTTPPLKAATAAAGARDDNAAV